VEKFVPVIVSKVPPKTEPLLGLTEVITEDVLNAIAAVESLP